MAWVQDGWEATPLLRWKAWARGPNTLQQLWIEVDEHGWHSLEKRRTEWRDVPTTEET